MVYILFYKISTAASANKYATHTGKGIYSENHQLAEELHKQIIRKYKKNKVYSSFKDNI